MAIRDLVAGMAQRVADKLGTGRQEGAEQPGIQDGNAPPTEGLTPNQQKYGPNYEQLKVQRPEIVAALQQLILEYRLEAFWSQRRKVRRIRQARDFWNEIQYCNYDGASDAFNFANGGQSGPIANVGDEQEDATGPRYQFTTNWFQAYGLSFIALVSQDVPSLSIYPRSREAQEYITAAKVTREVADLIERNNDPHAALEEIGKYLWTDGIVASYVRYVVDGDRFGYKEMPKMGLQVVNGMAVPMDQGIEKIPLGEEVITYVGGLELVLPNYADNFHECPYLQWNTEPHTARLKALFPAAADEIQNDSGMTADQIYERVVRLGVKQQLPYLLPGDALELLATFSRTWLRKWAFKRVEDKSIVAELEELYPDGAYVACAGLTYCESRSENVDKHWKVRHALPGDGQWHPAVGQSLISPSERYNVFSNLQTETIEYGIPPIYADPGVLDFDKLGSQVAEPAVHFPAKARPGLSLADGFFQPAPAMEPTGLPDTMRELAGPIMQFLCGMFPAIFGGEMSDVKTAAGYAMARDQAMGRLGLVWRGIKEFYAAGVALGVDCFRENRPEDVEIPFPGENDQEKAKWIRLADLRGNVIVKHEADEALPRLNSQQRAVLERLLEMGANMPPSVAKALEDPNNLNWMKTVLGLNEMVIPGENSSTKQMREIQMLLESGPMEFPPRPTPQTNPQTGETVIVMVPSPPQPTVGVNDLFDDHQLELDECCDWANSDAGQEAAATNKKGFMNVYLHAKMHADILQQRAQAAKQVKPPSEAINIKDVPAPVAAQMAEQAGLQATPDDFQAHQDQARADKAAELQARMATKGAGNVSSSPI